MCSHIVLLDFHKTAANITGNQCTQNLKDIAKEKIFYLDKLKLIMAILPKFTEKCKYFENYEIFSCLQIVID